jgi:RecB family endonuclease NucS
VGHQIIQQPDGLFAVFSNGVVDPVNPEATGTWILLDATADDLLDFYGQRAAAEARRHTMITIENVRAGQARKSYYQFTMTFEEADAQADVRAAVLDEQASGPGVEVMVDTEWKSTTDPVIHDPSGPLA